MSGGAYELQVSKPNQTFGLLIGIHKRLCHHSYVTGVTSQLDHRNINNEVMMEGSHIMPSPPGLRVQ